ncbi:MAG: hypothetical protein ACTSW1_09565 [Candidatus Hodarchaeales archaeon]
MRKKCYTIVIIFMLSLIVIFGLRISNAKIPVVNNQSNFESVPKQQGELETWIEDLDLTNNGLIDSVKVHNAIKFTIPGTKYLKMRITVLKWYNDEWLLEKDYQLTYKGNVNDITQYYDCWFIYFASSAHKYSIEIIISSLNENPELDIITATVNWTAQEEYKLIEDWSYTTNNLDIDEDGRTDSIEIDLKVKFHYSGQVQFSFFAQLTKLGAYPDLIRFIFDQEVVSDQWYNIQKLKFRAPDDGNFTIFMSCSSLDRSLVHFSTEIHWDNVYKAKIFMDYNFAFTEKDADLDGKKDSVEIDFNFISNINGAFAFQLSMKTYYFDETQNDWVKLIEESCHKTFGYFSQNVTRGHEYSLKCSFMCPFNGEFKISPVVIVPSFLDFPESSYAFSGNRFEGATLSLNSTYEEQDDTQKISLISSVNTSIGSIELDIELKIISTAGSFNPENWEIQLVVERIDWDSQSNTHYTWAYEHQQNLHFEQQFFLKVLYRDTGIFYFIKFIPASPIFDGLLIIKPYTSSTTEVNTPTTTTTTSWFGILSLFPLFLIAIVKSRRNQ